MELEEKEVEIRLDGVSSVSEFFGIPLSKFISKTEMHTLIINPEKEEWSFEKQYGFNSPRPVGPQVLIEIYLRKHSEVIESPEQAKNSQKYETIVGRICKLGSACYKGERFKDWAVEELPKVGDWVVFKRGGANLYKYGPPGKGVLLINIFDDNINDVIEDPSYVDRE